MSVTSADACFQCWVAAREYGDATSLDTVGDSTSLKSKNLGLYDDVVSYMRYDLVWTASAGYVFNV